MKRIDIPKETLRRLYVEEGLDSRKIADRFDCSKATVLKRLREYGLPVRTQGMPRRDDITRELLRELYVEEKLPTREIADRLDTGRSLVHRKLKKYNIPTRNIAESHIQYDRNPFSGDAVEKAYLIGFTVGDLRARKMGESSKTIKVDCGSTKQSQIDLFHELFSQYGRVWEGGPYEDGSVHVEAFLDESFSFLLDAREWFDEVWEDQFPSVFAGLVDAEGSFFITDGKACFSIGNYDGRLLSASKEGLEGIGIRTSKIYTDRKRYESGEGYTRNDFYKHFEVRRKESLLNLVELLEPYVKHVDRRNQMEEVRENILRRNQE